MDSQNLAITAITPPTAVPGGEVSIQCRGFRPGLPCGSKVLFGEIEAAIVSASAGRVVAIVPDSPAAQGVILHVDGATSACYPYLLGTRLASNLHPVTNPVISPDGDIITTISGSRGQQSDHPLVRITRDGRVTPFPCKVMNPTGLAYGAEGQLYISSRADGTILRYTDYEHLEVIAEDLGVPCGIVFDADGRLFVGDRTGNVFRIDPDSSRQVIARLPPSVSAYHLATDSEGDLYVTGPTLAMRDPVYRISRSGKITTILEGLARPQGLAVGREGDLWIAAAYGGKKGVFRYSKRSKTISHPVAGPMLVGLALEGPNIFLADNSGIFRLTAGDAAGSIS
ncbi:MAG: Gluconolactonase [Acidobacteria bacterium]|nr:Gluconolactonase [Acidobacteriota bacterium]